MDIIRCISNFWLKVNYKLLIYTIHISQNQDIQDLRICRINPERKLYLAISEVAYQDFFLKPAIQDILSDQQQINYIIFDPIQEVILQWIS